MLKNRKYLGIAIQILAVGAVYFGIQAYNKRDSASGPAPPLYGTLLNNSPIESLSLKGQTHVVHFWATWCTICRLEKSTINSIAEDYPVIALASQSGSRQEVYDYVQKQNITFPVLVDESGKFAKLFGVHAFPTTFIVNGDGNIQFVEVGYTTEIGLRSRLQLAK